MLVHECSVGAAETGAPPDRTSVFCEICGRTIRSQTICEHLWETLLCQKFLCVPWIPWENPTQPNHLCASVKSVGELLSGRRGYGRDAIPS